MMNGTTTGLKAKPIGACEVINERRLSHKRESVSQ